ncbi:MAG: bile acid:sodium symporter family protein [Alphaproteobacteria bacterium]|nr:bile acid:sodium symporter family protein [Alphaproteobacteria bacterium]
MGIITDVVLPLALAFIMLTLGLGLTGNDFKRVISQPRDFCVGLLSQILLLPMIGFLLISLWGGNISPELAMGVMLIAAAPGGATSNILTSFGRGDVALSVSMTAITSLLGLLTIPLIIGIAQEQLFGTTELAEFSISKLALSVFGIVTLPVCLGMFLRKILPNFSLRFEPIARKISTIFFILVLLGAIIKERSNIVPFFADAGMITLTLNVVMMFLAFYLAKIAGSGFPQRVAISIECGLQNGTLAIAVGTLLFGGGAYIIPAAIYSLIMFATALIQILFWRRLA